MQEQVVPAQVLLEHAHFEFLRTIPVQDGRQQQGLLIWPMGLVGTELDRPLRWMPPCLACSVHLDVEVPLPDQLPDRVVWNSLRRTSMRVLPMTWTQRRRI